METQKLGATNLSLSRVGLGCWAMGGHGYGKTDDNDSICAIKKALDLGVTLFDTADIYGFGHSEEVLAQALGSKRHDVIIATKFGLKWDSQGNVTKDCSPKRLIEALENSLKRLKIEAIPLYQIHWYDGKTRISDVIETLKICREKGKIREFGCSNFSLELMQEAWQTHRLESLQCECNVADPLDKKLAAFTTKNKVSVLAYNVLMRGLLSGKYNAQSKFGESDTRATDKHFQGAELERYQRKVAELKTNGAPLGLTPAQMAIRELLSDPAVSCAIVGAKTEQQVEANVAAITKEKV